MNQLGFVPAEFRPSELRALHERTLNRVPDSAGVYILVTKRGTTFRYPKGRSAVFYIGQAARLRKRLLEHLKYTTEARNHRRRPRYWPRYEYAAVFGARYATILRSSRWTSRSLEGRIVRAFADMFRAQPVANSQGSWAKGRQE